MASEVHSDRPELLTMLQRITDVCVLGTVSILYSVAVFCLKYRQRA